MVDNFSTGRRENLTAVLADIEIVEGDLQSYERAHNAVRGCELVFHQAALPSVPRSIQDPLTSTMVNVVGTLNVKAEPLDCMLDVTKLGRPLRAVLSGVHGHDERARPGSSNPD